VPRITRHPDGPEYVATFGAHGTPNPPAGVRIGGRHETTGARFVPNINASRFGDRAWLNVNHRGTVPGRDEVPAFDEATGKVELRAGGALHRWYADAPDCLEYEMVFDAKPNPTTIVFDLGFPEGLTFHYQPALTSEEIAAGFERPEYVVGSYAVYWRDSGRVVRPGGTEVVNFATGKFCHIYRPRLIDADGATAWCELEINPLTRQMRVIMPPAWLNAARYPVTLDPTFGYATIGGSSYWTNANRLFLLRLDPPSSGGTISSFHWYTTLSQSMKVTLGLYEGAAGPGIPLVADSAGSTESDTLWVVQAADTPVAIATGSTYSGAMIAEKDFPKIYFDTVSGWNNRFTNTTYSHGNLPNPSPGGTYYDASNQKVSWYCTYELAGGVAPAIAAARRRREC